MTRHQRGFTGVHPSRPFPCLWPPDGTRALGLYPGLRTRPGRTQPRTPGRERASGTTRSYVINILDLPQRAHSHRATSCRTAPSPCGPPSTVARLAGRHPGDYYGHSVAIELASLRRSHVRNCRTYQRDLGVPFVSFNAPTGHRSRTPEDCRKYLLTSRQGPAPVTGVFPAGARITPSGDWASGNPTFAISRGSPGAPPRTPGHGHRFPGLLFSPLTFRITGQPSDPKTPPPVPARYAGDTAVRLVAHPGCGPAGRSTRQSGGQSRPGRAPVWSSPP
jgi:hypothetical protein